MISQFNKSSRLRELAGRVERCCCRYCGSPLELKRITFSNFEDSRVEIFCSKCGRIEYGTEPEIYESAKYFVEHFDFNWYTYLDENAQTCQMTIAKICDILSWHDQQLGILGQRGYNIPVKQARQLQGDRVALSDEELDSELQRMQTMEEAEHQGEAVNLEYQPETEEDRRQERENQNKAVAKWYEYV